MTELQQSNARQLRRNSFFTSQVSAKEAACASLTAPPLGKREARRGHTGLPAKDLFNVSGDQLGHLEHTDLTFAIENGTERVIGINLGSFLFILATVFLNVVPQFFRELGTRERFRTNDGGEFIIRLDGAHECGVRLAFGLFGFGFRHDR
jgi:hypothetical protein